MSTIRRRTATADTTSTTRPPTRHDAQGPTRRVGSPGAGIRAALKRHAETRTGAFPEVKLDEAEKILAMLDDDMVAGWYVHWVDAAPKRKSWLCLANPSAGDFVGADPDDERGCPLCEIKDLKKPVFKAAFNVVELGDWDKQDPVVAVLETGVTLAQQITDAAESPRSSPIDRGDIVFAVKRTAMGEGANKKYTFSFSPLKVRDLEEYYGTTIQPLSDEQRAALLDQRYDKDTIVKRDTYEDLVALVEELYG